MEEEEGDVARGGHHIGKRFRKNKNSVAVFDDKARQYVAASVLHKFLEACLEGIRLWCFCFSNRKWFVIVVVVDVCSLLTYREYLTGFRQRKNKRRKVADQQNTIKERQRRLQDRKEVSSIVLFVCVYKVNEYCLAFVLGKLGRWCENRHSKHRVYLVGLY